MFNEEIIERVFAEFEAIRAEIIERYYAKRMYASGELPKSLEVVKETKGNNTTIMLLGNKYVEQLEYGRRASTKAPPMQALFEWVKNKRILDGAATEAQIKSVAFAIAMKIKRKGYDRKDWGGVGLISEVFTDQRIKSILDLVGKEITPIFTAQIITMFNKK